MKQLDRLYEEIEKNDIMLFDYEVPNFKASALCLDSQYGIFADYKHFETLQEEFCCIAHEFAHCMTGTTHSEKANFETVARCEYRAFRYSVRQFLPVEEIKKALKKGYTELWELSEYLDLPEEFILKAINIYNLA